MLFRVKPSFVFDTDESGGGGPEPSPIHWESVDPSTIPVEVIKSTPAFKEVLDESIERRKKLKALSEAMKNEKPGSLGNDSGSAENKPLDSASDVLEILRQELSEIKSALTKQQEASMRQWKDQALALTGLPKEMADRIKGNSFEEVLADAQTLAKYLNITPPQAGRTANPSYQTDESRREIIRKKVLGQWNSVRPFDPGLQRQLGGGFTELNE